MISHMCAMILDLSFLESFPSFVDSWTKTMKSIAFGNSSLYFIAALIALIIVHLPLHYCVVGSATVISMLSSVMMFAAVTVSEIVNSLVLKPLPIPTILVRISRVPILSF